MLLFVEIPEDKKIKVTIKSWGNFCVLLACVHKRVP